MSVGKALLERLPECPVLLVLQRTRGRDRDAAVVEQGRRTIQIPGLEQLVEALRRLSGFSHDPLPCWLRDRTELRGGADEPLVQGVVEAQVAGAAANGTVQDGDLSQELDVGLDGDEGPASGTPDQRLAVVTPV